MAFVYSCCFWFSLRLGGIVIGIFSLLQGFLVMVTCSAAYTHSQALKDEISSWINNVDLIYTKGFFNSFQAEPWKFLTLFIIFTCIYIILAIMYIYGAYVCNNTFMLGFILVEFLRLLSLSLVVATWLLVLKHNTMDIGLLILASVVGGFFLLGMFYLWICAANLPILINEMERDEQAALIDKLQGLLDSNRTNKSVHGYEDIILPAQKRFSIKTTNWSYDNERLSNPIGNPYY